MVINPQHLPFPQVEQNVQSREEIYRNTLVSLNPDSYASINGLIRTPMRPALSFYGFPEEEVGACKLTAIRNFHSKSNSGQSRYAMFWLAGQNVHNVPKIAVG
jgi:hypothetical protein